jgi:hypothetical protein
MGALGAALMAADVDANEAEPVPAALVAVTLNVYAVPAARFVETSHVVEGAEIVQVAPATAMPESLYACAVYEVITAPFAAGAVHATVTFPVPEVTDTPVGALGTPAGVTVAEGADSTEVLTPLVAVALKVYSEPLVNPETVQEVEGDVMVQVLPEIAAPVAS